MNVADITSLYHSLSQSGLLLDIHNMFLKDFVKEDQFTEAVRLEVSSQPIKQLLIILNQ